MARPILLKWVPATAEWLVRHGTEGTITTEELLMHVRPKRRPANVSQLNRVLEIQKELPTEENMEELLQIAEGSVPIAISSLDAYFLGVLEKHHGGLPPDYDEALCCEDGDE